ncbi:MAG: polysaccharide pyruvyl transferase family protein [Ruminiclostridium sp.]|nr:polysaccharide pyruvyl transferase family protein [Ruminiclostridium sp.]
MKHYLLYGHGGSYNHGSEASVKCDIGLLRRISPGCRITLSSHFPEQDRQLNIDADEIIGRSTDAETYEEMYAETIARITPETICLSVGGDTYCYPAWQRYAAIHNAAKKIGAKSILWSCSLEPPMIDDEMLGVLRTHDLIAARESITAGALRELGLDNVVQIPDIAFGLTPEETKIPDKKYVSVNLSPLVIRKNPDVLTAYQALVDEILDRTDLDIAFVPHVEVSVDNDKDALDMLRGDESRIFRVPAGLCAARYKYIIGHSEICVASRTHATIAAWSCGVPAIAVGYSTKARGIARDLGQEEWVTDVKELTENTLAGMFAKMIHDPAPGNRLKAVLHRYCNSGSYDPFIKYLI